MFVSDTLAAQSAMELKYLEMIFMPRLCFPLSFSFLLEELVECNCTMVGGMQF